MVHLEAEDSRTADENRCSGENDKNDNYAQERTHFQTEECESKYRITETEKIEERTLDLGENRE